MGGAAKGVQWFTLGGLLLGLGKAWFWLSQLTTVIGLASIADDIRVWIDLWHWALSGIRDWVPQLGALVEWLVEPLHEAIGLFRSLIRPAVGWLLGWLPWDLPGEAKDLLVIALLAVSGQLRARLLYGEEAFRAFMTGMDEVAAAARVQGLPDHVGVFAAVEDYAAVQRERAAPKPSAYLIQIHQQSFDAKLAKYGPGLTTVAEQTWRLLRQETTRIAYRREAFYTCLTWGLCGAVGTLYLLDLAIYGAH